MNRLLKFLLYLKLKKILEDFEEEAEANRQYRLVQAKGRIFPGELVVMNPDGTVSSALKSSDDQLDLLRSLCAEKEKGMYGINDAS
jgi:hypothetical protein